MGVLSVKNVLEAIYTASSHNKCDTDLAIEIINDLPDVYEKPSIDKYDIVYILKADIDSEELKYSLRSVVKYLPYNRIVFYCGCPNDIKPDIMVPFNQTEDGKIKRVIQTLKAVVENDDLTEDFWLFNDDFFLMKPLTSVKPICNGTLYSVIHNIESSTNKVTKYTYILRDTAAQLLNMGLDTISYASHTPMLINRKKAKEVLDKFNSPFSFRTAYGNYWHVEGIIRPDVKISKENQNLNKQSDLLSTNDKTFAKGEVGSFIRSIFPEPSKYELK